MTHKDLTEQCNYPDCKCPTENPCLKGLAQPEQEPVAMKFKIYLPVKHQINHANLPWVYDQDRSTGNVASMWVTPVATLPPKRTWVGLTDDEIDSINYTSAHMLAKEVEAKLKERNT